MSRIEHLTGVELEAEIRNLAIITKPENFENMCNSLQILLDEQNARARHIANKYKRTFINRTVADVYRRYWLANTIERSRDGR